MKKTREKVSEITRTHCIMLINAVLKPIKLRSVKKKYYLEFIVMWDKRSKDVRSNGQKVKSGAETEVKQYSIILFEFPNI